jgi:hypothetical protein
VLIGQRLCFPCLTIMQTSPPVLLCAILGQLAAELVQLGYSAHVVPRAAGLMSLAVAAATADAAAVPVIGQAEAEQPGGKILCVRHFGSQG